MPATGVGCVFGWVSAARGCLTVQRERACDIYLSERHSGEPPRRAGSEVCGRPGPAAVDKPAAAAGDSAPAGAVDADPGGGGSAAVAALIGAVAGPEPDMPHRRTRCSR